MRGCCGCPRASAGADAWLSNNLALVLLSPAPTLVASLIVVSLGSWLLGEPGVHADVPECSDASEARLLLPAAAAAAAAALPAAADAAAQCSAPTFQTLWTGACVPAFGVDPELRLAADDARCDSLARCSCGGADWPAPAPRGFRVLAAHNDGVLRSVQRVEAHRTWASGAWAAIAGSCSRAASDGLPDAAGAAWLDGRVLAFERAAARGRRGLGLALALLVSSGAAAPLEVRARRYATNRSLVVLQVSVRVSAAGGAAGGALDAASRFEARLGGALAAAASGDSPRTLYGYALREASPCLACESWTPGGPGRWEAPEWVRSLASHLAGEGPEAVLGRVDGVWFPAAGVAASLASLADAHPDELAAYGARQLRAAYPAAAAWPRAATAREMLGAAAPSALSPAHFALSPAHARATSPGGRPWERDCAAAATREVWWRIDSFFAQLQADAEAQAAVRATFEAVRASHARLVGEALRGAPRLRAHLLRKLGAVRLRFAAGGREPARGPQLAAPSHTLQVAAARRGAFERFAPRFSEEAGRVLDVTDVPTTQPNAFYSATDNSLTIFAGLLGGAFYDRSAAAQPRAALATLGFVLGHELSHAVDSQGVWYDAEGNAGEHAPRAETARYIAGMRCLADRLRRAGLPDRMLNEAFADSLGVRAAYGAWAGAGGEEPRAAQEFFVSFGQLWCGAGGSAGGDHPPPAFRAATAQQALSGAFARAFGRDEDAGAEPECVALG